MTSYKAPVVSSSAVPSTLLVFLFDSQNYSNISAIVIFMLQKENWGLETVSKKSKKASIW